MPLIGERMDKVLPSLFQDQVPELSRSRLQTLMEQGHLTCNGEIIPSAKLPLRSGVYILTLPEAEESHLIPESMSLDIVFEDEDIIVLNKPAGLTVHPGAGQHQGTLVNALIHDYGETLSGVGGVKRPGIVHRLDKDTSGLMVVAKNDLSHQRLSAQFADHTLSRTYVCLVFGEPMPHKGVIKTQIGRHPTQRQKMAVMRSEASGKTAITHYAVMEVLKNQEDSKHPLSIVECRLKTGRTHQIRVHMSYIGCPLLGDPVYGKKNTPLCWRESLEGFHRQALHARALEFIHPRTLQHVKFQVDWPEDMSALLKRLRSHMEG